MKKKIRQITKNCQPSKNPANLKTRQITESRIEKKRLNLAVFISFSMKSPTSLKNSFIFQTRRLQWRAEKSRQRMLLHGKRGRIRQFSVSPLRCHVHGTLQAQKRGPPRLVHAPLFKRRPQLHWPDWGAQSGSGKTSILHGRHARLRISNGNFFQIFSPQFESI